MILEPLCPFDQLTEQPAQTLEAERVTLSPEQRLVEPEAVTVGADGVEQPNWVTSIVRVMPLHPMIWSVAVRVELELFTL